MGVWIINSRLETIIYIGVGNYSYPSPPPARLTRGSLYGGGGGRKARTCTVKMREIMMQKLHFFDATLIHFFGPRLLSLLLIPLKSRNKLDGARCTFWPVHSWTARVNEKNACKNIHFLRTFWTSFGGLLILLSAPRTPHKIGWFSCGSVVPRPNNSIVSGWHERLNRPSKIASIYGKASKTGWFSREKGSVVKVSRLNPP